jgi:hypothetical protein
MALVQSVALRSTPPSAPPLGLAPLELSGGSMAADSSKAPEMTVGSTVSTPERRIWKLLLAPSAGQMLMADVATDQWRDSRQKSSKGGGDENDNVGVHVQAIAPHAREGRGIAAQCRPGIRSEQPDAAA